MALASGKPGILISTALAESLPTMSDAAISSLCEFDMGATSPPGLSQLTVGIELLWRIKHLPLLEMEMSDFRVFQGESGGVCLTGVEGGMWSGGPLRLALPCKLLFV